MTTINIHKDKLLPAAFAYQQRKLKEIMVEQEEMVEDEFAHGWMKWPWKPKTKFEAAKRLSENHFYWKHLTLCCQDYTVEYVKLQTACRVAEDGIISLDIDVVQRIFGEE